MTATADVVFLLAVAWFLVHELDAVRRHEWRFFVARVPVSDETAYRAFVALHAPAVVFVVWNLDSVPFQVGFDAFAIVHAALHLLLRDHPALTFDDWFGWLWIYGWAALGALHLLLLWG